MNSVIGPICNESFIKKRFVGPVNNTQNPLEVH